MRGGRSALLVGKHFAEAVDEAYEMEPIQVRECRAAVLGRLHGMRDQGQVCVRSLLLQQRRLVLAQRAQHAQRLPDTHHLPLQLRIHGRLRMCHNTHHLF